MFKNVLIFFSALFFFFSSSFELNSLTRDQVLKIKQKVSVVNSVITKVRFKQFKLNIKIYKKSKIVFDVIKKENWKEAKKLARNDEVLKKIIDSKHAKKSILLILVNCSYNILKFLKNIQFFSYEK